MVARLVAAVLCAGVLIQRWGPADLVALPERPYADARPGVLFDGPAYPRAAVGADGVRVQLAQAPNRIASQDSHADEFLYAIVPPARVVGVSPTAYERRVSTVLDLVEQYHPAIAIDPERLLRTGPALVIAPASARAETVGQLRHAGLPVYRIDTMFETLGAIRDHMRLVGYLTGEDDRAAAAIDRFDRRVSRAVMRRPPGVPAPRVLGLGGSYSYGSHTLFADILRLLGAENVAAVHGLAGYDRLTDEHIVRWDPDWIVAGADRGTVEATRRRLLANPAVAATAAARHGHIIVLENRVFLPLSPYTVALVEALAGALYAERAA